MKALLALLIVSVFSMKVFAKANFKTINVTYHFADKTVKHTISAQNSNLKTERSDDKPKQRKLEQDDIDFTFEKVNELSDSKDKKENCRLSYVEFEVVAASGPDKRFTVCRNNDSRFKRSTDILLKILDE